VLAGEEVYDEDGNVKFEGAPEAYRGLFLIDKSGIVRHQIVNDMPLGRSVEEIIRVIDALQFTEEYGEVCPANWKKGDKALKATQEGIASYLSENKSDSELIETFSLIIRRGCLKTKFETASFLRMNKPDYINRIIRFIAY